jgi:hypothetical protein
LLELLGVLSWLSVIYSRNHIIHYFRTESTSSMGSHQSLVRLALSAVTVSVILVPLQRLRAADASTVSIDWSARTTGQQACVAPSASGSSTASVTLSNANTILYTYTLDVKSYQLPSNDAGSLPAAAPISPEANLGAAPNQTTYDNDLALLLSTGSIFPKMRRSVPLDETITAFKEPATAAAIADVISNRSRFAMTVRTDLKAVVNQAVDALTVYQQKYQALTANANQSTVTFSYQIDGTHYYLFAVREKSRYDGRLTDATLRWKCGLEDVLTLSVGVMGTTLASRTYISQSVPNGATTQNVLSVNGASGWTPQGLALLNYKIHVIEQGPQLGFAFSTGPAFKFGGTPNVSNFGWFAGISVSLWRRVFITPGVHLGQFADFPPGFATGSVIPANFGTLTPVARWSGHFAIGITFQTNAFVKSSSQAATPPSAGK